MKPLDPESVPEHIRRRRGGRTGLVHGQAPTLPREFMAAAKNRTKKGRKGAKARAKMARIVERRGKTATIEAIRYLGLEPR